jgi:hypothetical protein
VRVETGCNYGAEEVSFFLCYDIGPVSCLPARRIRGPAAALLVWIIDQLYWLSVAALWFRRGWEERAMFYALQPSVAWNPIRKLQRLVPSLASHLSSLSCVTVTVRTVTAVFCVLWSNPCFDDGSQGIPTVKYFNNLDVILCLILPVNVTGECYLIFQRVLVRRVSCATFILTGKPKRLQSSLRSRII